MSKKISIKLDYVDEKGKAKTTSFRIGKIYNWAIREFQEIQDQAIEVQKKFESIKKYEASKSDIIKSGADDWHDQLKDVNKITDELADDIKAVGAGDFFKKRVALISGILKDNGYTDPIYKDFDFWDRRVEPDQIINFLTFAVYKDLDVGGSGTKTGKK